jgi:hypothetical protein
LKLETSTVKRLITLITISSLVYLQNAYCKVATGADVLAVRTPGPRSPEVRWWDREWVHRWFLYDRGRRRLGCWPHGCCHLAVPGRDPVRVFLRCEPSSS